MSQFYRNRRRRQSGEPCDCLRPLIRIFGFISAIVLCGVGVDLHLHGYIIGIILLISTMFMIFFETKWIITLFLELLFANENYSICLECWSFCRFFGSWRLAFPYILIGIALMMWPHNLWLSYVAGILMILLALLRLCLIFRFSNNFKDEELLPQSDFDKIESGSNRRDDGFVEIVPSLEEEEPIDDVC